MEEDPELTLLLRQQEEFLATVTTPAAHVEYASTLERVDPNRTIDGSGRASQEGLPGGLPSLGQQERLHAILHEWQFTSRGRPVSERPTSEGPVGFNLRREHTTLHEMLQCLMSVVPAQRTYALVFFHHFFEPFLGSTEAKVYDVEVWFIYMALCQHGLVDRVFYCLSDRNLSVLESSKTALSTLTQLERVLFYHF